MGSYTFLVESAMVISHLKKITSTTCGNMTPATNNWKWSIGSNKINQKGLYGTLGVAATANMPGARNFAKAWISGTKAYLFGGNGYSAARYGYHNDLWQNDVQAGTWRWLNSAI